MPFLKDLERIEVIKEDGALQPFSWPKLHESLERAHVDPKLCESVGEHLSDQLHHTCTTHDIRNAVKKYLKKRNKYAAARYDLRRALMELGPSGFPFERYISYLLTELGYKTKIGEIVKGKCVTHEVDVIAEKDGIFEMIECKYHNRFGTKSDVKVAMYVYARFQDIKEAWDSKIDQSQHFHSGWLITNTKLTQDARQFAMCRGLKVMSWNYPHDHSLQDLISQTCLYPITSLSTLKKKTLQTLIEHDIVACKQLKDLNPDTFLNGALKSLLPHGELTTGQHEAKLVCDLPQ